LLLGDRDDAEARKRLFLATPSDAPVWADGALPNPAFLALAHSGESGLRQGHDNIDLVRGLVLGDAPAPRAPANAYAPTIFSMQIDWLYGGASVRLRMISIP
jgi:hypothetical protein